MTEEAALAGGYHLPASGLSPRCFTTAISSQHWNFGQRRQSFHALRGRSPRSISDKAQLAKEVRNVGERENVRHFKSLRFFHEGIDQDAAASGPLELQVASRANESRRHSAYRNAAPRSPAVGPLRMDHAEITDVLGHLELRARQHDTLRGIRVNQVRETSGISAMEALRTSRKLVPVGGCALVRCT